MEVMFSIEALSKDHRKDVAAMHRQWKDPKRNMLLGLINQWGFGLS